MVCWGVEFLIHCSVTHIVFAIGVHHCIAIVITVIILCAYEFVDLGTIKNFGQGSAKVEWSILFLGSKYLYTAIARSQMCWIE